MRKMIAVLLLIWSPFAVLAEAATETKEEAKNWKGDIQFGYVMTSGNTENTNINGKIHLGGNLEKWRHLVTVEAFSTSDNDRTTAEHYKLKYQVDRKYKDGHYFFTNTAYEEDRFSGYDYRSTISAGYGFRAYDKNKMTLDTEFGAGYRHSMLIVDPVTGATDEENEAMLRLAAKYHWDIEENRSLMSDLTVDAGENTTISELEVGFVTMIAGDLSFKASYMTRYTSDVPVDKEKLDTITSINLLYAF